MHLDPLHSIQEPSRLLSRMVTLKLTIGRLQDPKQNQSYGTHDNIPYGKITNIPTYWKLFHTGFT